MGREARLSRLSLINIGDRKSNVMHAQKAAQNAHEGRATRFAMSVDFVGLAHTRALWTCPRDELRGHWSGIKRWDWCAISL